MNECEHMVCVHSQGTGQTLFMMAQELPNISQSHTWSLTIPGISSCFTIQQKLLQHGKFQCIRGWKFYRTVNTVLSNQFDLKALPTSPARVGKTRRLQATLGKDACGHKVALQPWQSGQKEAVCITSENAYPRATHVNLFPSNICRE